MRIKGLTVSTIFLVAGLFVFIENISAADVYISQTASGSDNGAGCIDAHSIAWLNTAGNWANPKQTGKIGPGDTVHLCGTISTSLFIRGSGSSGSPITILFEPGAKLSAPTWTGAWYGVEGAVQATNVNYIVLDGGTNGVIEATDSGTDLQQVGSMGIMFSHVSDSEIRNLNIRNMYVRTSTEGEDGGGTAMYINAGSNNSIHDNHITETQTAIVYVYPQGGSSDNIAIYNNTISRMNWGIILGESNNDAKADNVSIYSNDISDMYNWDDPNDNFHHDGIYAYAEADGDVVTNLRVFGNYIHGDMGLHVTAMIFTSGNVIDPIYFDNVLVNTGPHGISNGLLCAGGRIYHNTFVDHYTSMGIDAWSGSDIRNNLFYNTSVPVAIHQPVGSAYSDHNLFFSGNVQMVTFDSTGTGHFYSLSEWRSDFGLDQHSITDDPLLMDPIDGNYRLQAGSPAIDIGESLSCTDGLCLDKDGITRPQDSGWDIGAYEYISGTGTVCGDGTCESGETPAGCPADCGGTSSCTTGADNDGDSAVSTDELIDYISEWKSGSVSISDLIAAIAEWKDGC